MSYSATANFVEFNQGLVEEVIPVREKMKAKDAVDAFVKDTIRVSIDDKKKYHVVVYNPYNHESVVAAAILQNRFCERAIRKDGSLSETMSGTVKFVSFQDIIPSNAANYIWLGVDPKNFLASKLNKASVNVHYDYSQPAITKPRQLSALDKVFGKQSITSEELLYNNWYEYCNGPVNFDDEFLDPTYCTLIDKIMCDFKIDDIGNYGYRHISSLCKSWEDGSIDESREAAFYMTVMAAVKALEESSEFRVRYGTSDEVTAYSDLLKTRYKALTNKAAQQRAPTVNGVKNVAVISVGPEMFYIAHRHFGKLDMKYINVTQGMNGRLFTGNVRIRDAEFLDGKVIYVD